MIEVFRRRKRLYLVFEYLDHTVLDELEEAEGGLDWERSRRHIFQILRGLDFCHHHKVSETLITYPR
jgi:cyclin-dependent kinase-like